MAEISLICTSVCLDKDKPTRRSAVAVDCRMVDEYRRNISRIIAEPVGDSDKPRAELLAARVALMCIGRKYRKISTIKLVASQFIIAVLDVNSDVLEKLPNDLQSDARALLQWYNFFPDISVLVGDESTMHSVKVLARQTADTQRRYDTGTRTS